jgi:hypothetical protein
MFDRNEAYPERVRYRLLPSQHFQHQTILAEQILTSQYNCILITSDRSIEKIDIFLSYLLEIILNKDFLSLRS